MTWVKPDSSQSGSPAAQDGQGGRAVAGRQQLVRDVRLNRRVPSVRQPTISGGSRAPLGSVLVTQRRRAAATTAAVVGCQGDLQEAALRPALAERLCHPVIVDGHAPQNHVLALQHREALPLEEAPSWLASLCE